MQALWIPPVLEAVWNAPLTIEENTLFAARRAAVVGQPQATCFVEHIGAPFLAAVLEEGVASVLNRLCAAQRNDPDPDRREARRRMAEALESTLTLTGRYMALAYELEETACAEERARLFGIRKILECVPERGAQTLREAIQAYLILLEAFEVEHGGLPLIPGDLDRLFEPFYAREKLSRKAAAALFADALGGYARLGAVVLGGRDASGNDLSGKTSQAFIDALSGVPGARVVLRRHKGTSQALLRAAKKLPNTRYIDDDGVFSAVGFKRDAALWHVFLPETPDAFWARLDEACSQIRLVRKRREAPLIVALMGDVETCQPPVARFCLIHGLESADRALSPMAASEAREQIAQRVLAQTGLEAIFT